MTIIFYYLYLRQLNGVMKNRPYIYQVVKKRISFEKLAISPLLIRFFMKIGTIHLILGSIYKNHSSNLCSIEDNIQNAPEVMFFQFHYAQIYQIYRAE